ncbi:hypothetical protein ACEZCY_04085 [Streptacidiphilus sp. N1-12]|uniref:Uncharacterized protein n=2 Tax=Streptacidiphilus alkalitolerans TaxID=3342712 RepID=A0ABV6W8S1_9ACTN
MYLGGLEVDLGVGEATPEHVANHDPRRAPARVARERRLLDLLLAEKHQVPGGFAGGFLQAPDSGAE